MNKSLSESNIKEIEESSMNVTPPNFVFDRAYRAKKRKERDSVSPKEPVDGSEFEIFKEEMRSMITSLFMAQQSEMKEINIKLQNIQESNNNIQDSIAFLTAQNADFKTKIEKLELQAIEDKKNITLLEDKLENLQKGLRKSNLEIKNVPKKQSETKEDLMKMITSLTATVGATLTQADIKDIYRVRGKKEGNINTPIVIETSSTILKADLLKKCKIYNNMNKTKLRTKHLGFVTSEETPIYVSEQLTPKSARLYFLARDLIKSTNYMFCWTSYGNVYVRKNESAPIITITSEAQIHQLVQRA